MHIALVVEDNASLNRLYTKVLVQAGLTVYQALSCQQAFNHLSDIVPNIIFLDMGLPDGNGIAIAEYVRSKNQFAQTRIIGVSGAEYNFGQHDQSLLNQYQYKPVSTVAIRDLCDTAITVKSTNTV